MNKKAMQTESASATSLNFLGFEDMRGFGTPPLLFGQIIIEPNQAETAGINQLAVAGFVPGQQSYIKTRRAVWSKSKLAQSLERQGFRTVHI